MINPGANTFANPPGRSGISSIGIKPVSTNITFSVGTAASPADQYVTKDSSGAAPSVNIENSIATFSVPQTHPYIGVGDKIILADTTEFYLNEKITTSEWHVLSADGTDPSATVSAISSDVVSIDKTFNTLEDAIDGDASGVFNLLGTHNLTAFNSNLKITCYEMIDDIASNQIDISGLWVTDEFNRIKIIVPIDNKLECNSPQRRMNGAVDGYVLTGTFIITGRIVINRNTDIEGLEIKGNSAYGVQCDVDNKDNWSVTYCIINGSTNGVSTTFIDPPLNQVVCYNLIENCSGDGINVLYNATIFNNTIVDGGNGIEYKSTTNLDIRNNICQNMTGAGFEDNAVGGSVLDSNISDDAIPAGGTNNQSSLTMSFINTATENYRTTIITRTETNTGTAISDFLDYKFIFDIEGKTLSPIPSIGAFSQPSTIEYAIGPNTDINTGGNFTYSNATATMTFTVAQTSVYLCAGCKVNGTYYLRRKVSTTEWEVSDNQGVYIPGSVGSTLITSIVPPFPDLYEALIGDGTISTGIYLEYGSVGFDFPALDVQITLNCTTGKSNRGVPNAGFLTVDQTRNIVIQTPNTLTGYNTNCNTTRRHDGKWRLTKENDQSDNLFIHSGGNGATPHGFALNKQYMVFNGLQITSDGDGIFIPDDGGNFVIINNIIRNCTNGVRVESKDEGGDNIIISNLIFDCKNDGINIIHKAGLQTESIFPGITNQQDSFKVTVIKYGYDDGDYQVKLFDTPNVTNSVIRWYPGLVEIFHNNKLSMFSILATLDEETGVPWGTIEAIDSEDLRGDFHITMREAEVNLTSSYTRGNHGIQHKVVDIYGNTVTNCDRGIFIDSISNRQSTNFVYLKNNACQYNTTKDFLTSSVNPLFVFGEGNVSSDITGSKLRGIDNTPNFSMHFVNRPAKDFRITLYDGMAIPASVLSADTRFPFSNDAVGFNYNTHGWVVGFMAYNALLKGLEVNLSIGTDTSNLDPFPGGRTIDITNGVATFSSNGTGTNLSVGDKVTYASGTGYLAERGTSHIWKIVDNTGLLMPDTTASVVTDIKRVFNSISDISGAGVIPLETELGTRDLVANTFNLYLWCTNDGVDSLAAVVDITGWTTSVLYRFKVTSPHDTKTQSIIRHRHAGALNSGYTYQQTGAVDAILVSDDFVHIEGITILKDIATGTCVSAPASDNVIIEGNVIFGGDKGIHLVSSASLNFVVANICMEQTSNGIQVTRGKVTMCTVVNGVGTGYNSTNSIDTVEGCLGHNNGTDFSWNTPAQQKWCISQDGTVSGSPAYNNWLKSLHFKDPASNDFHLHRTDWMAINRAPDFGNEENDLITGGLLTQYNVYKDVDAEELKPDNYSRGADSLPDLATKQLYVSVGVNAGNLLSGINTKLRIINNVVIFDFPQTNDNMGIGDSIDYDFDNKIVYLRQKINDSQWVVGDKFGESISDIDPVDVNEIKHVFNDLAIMFDDANANSIYAFYEDDTFFLIFSPLSGRYKLNIACYKGITQHNQFIISSFETDKNHNIRIYTPNNVALECNVRQSHDGIRGGSDERVMIDTGNDDPCIRVFNNHTDIDGLILIGNQSNTDACIELVNSEDSIIRNNICYNAQDGIRTEGSGRDDPIRVDTFDDGIDGVWDTDFTTNWSTKEIHGNFVAYDPGSNGNTFVTDAVTRFSTGTDVEFSFVQGAFSEIDDSISIGFHNNTILLTSIVMTSTSITFNGVTVPIKHIHGREIRCIMAHRKATQGNGTTNATSGNFFYFAMFDEFDDGIFSNAKIWFQPAIGNSSTEDVAVVVNGGENHGFGYLKVFNDNDTPLATHNVGKNLRNIFYNNIVYGHLVSGIFLSGTDTCYNNTVDNCGLNGYVYFDTDDLKNCLGSNNQIASFGSQVPLLSCMTDDNSIVDNTKKNNVGNTVITYNDSASVFENRDYRLFEETSQRGQGINLKGNPVIPFNLDASPFQRGRFWGPGALEYIPKVIVFAVGRDTGDIKTNVESGTLTYIISPVIIFSLITFSEPQTDIRFGIGNEIIDTATPFSQRCFLSFKLSDSIYIVSDRFGTAIPDRNGSVNSIIRPFSTLYEASQLIPDNEHITSKNLQFMRLRLRLACYDDGQPPIPEDGAIFDGYNTDVDHYLIIMTPDNIFTECNQTQRHAGKFSGSGYKLAVGSSSFNPTALTVSDTSHVEIVGLTLSSKHATGSGLNILDVHDSTVAYNIISECNDNGILYTIIDGFGYKDQIYNNLVYNCTNDAIHVESNFNASLTEDDELNVVRSIMAIKNNTLVGCKRGIYFSKSDQLYSNIADIRNNLCQGSTYRDIAIVDFDNFANLFPIKNLVSDDSADVLPDDNVRGTLITFIDKPNGNFYLNQLNDSIAIDNAEDGSPDVCFPFFDDIVGNLRDPGDWDIGAFENVDIEGEGDLSIGPVFIVGAGSEGTEPDDFEIYLREPGPAGNLDQNFLPNINPTFQFISIDDFGGDPDWEINAFLATKLTLDNLVIHVHGDRVFKGTFELLIRTTDLTVTIRTYQPESSDGPASLIYDGPLVDDMSSQGELILRDIKIYSVDAATQPYLVNTTAATNRVRLINSIVQVNKNSVLGNVTGYVQSINSIVVYRNNDTDIEMSLTLSTDSGGSLFANSIALLSLGIAIPHFVTKPSPVLDEIHNSLSYNYDAPSTLNFNNLPGKMFNNLDNTDPLFTDATISTQLFDISGTMSKAFLPLLESPVVDAGENSFITVAKDIVANPRIYISGVVDIGPYELKVNQIIFTSDDIQSVFQEKLRINYSEQRYDPLYGDKVYKDLFSQFNGNETFREEFTREAKVILELKRIVVDRQFLTDKENIELTRFEAYFDLSAQSIVLSRNGDNIGKLLSSLFDDGRYVFFFDEISHILIVYLNDTWDKGMSGKRNIVNNVRFGGTSTVSV